MLPDQAIRERAPCTAVAAVDSIAMDSDCASLVREVAGLTGLKGQQIEIVEPGDRKFSSKVEPETSRVAGTLIRSHLVPGLASLIIGLLVAWALVAYGPSVTRSSPLMTFIGLGLLSPFIGMFIAGAISLRPDHDLLVSSTRKATGRGKWTVVAHCENGTQRERVRQVIEPRAQTL